MLLQCGAVQRQQGFPAKLRGDNRLTAVGRLGELVRHLEEEEQGELLHVFEAGEPGVLEDPGVTPGALADGGCVHAFHK